MSDDSDSNNKAATSSGSTDNAIPLVNNKRHRNLIIHSSEDDSSSSEDEEIVAVRRGKKTPQIQSDYESGNSDAGANDSGSSSDSDADQKASKNLADKLMSDSSSDYDSQSEKCPICLMKFKTQEVGSLDSCDHCFCLACIQEWAKNAPTCPVDRQSFTLILVREELEGKVTRQIPVTAPSHTPVPEEDLTPCEVCGESNREDRMLLCDWCDQGYHMECLNPPLEVVPIEEWFCPNCTPALNSALYTEYPLNAEQSSDGDVEELLRTTRRLVPRTRQSERVRSSVNRARQQGRAQQPSTSSGVESMEGETASTRSTPRQRRTKRGRRKTKAKSRFRVKRIMTDDGVIEVVLKRKNKKKTRKKHKSRTVRATPRTVKGRLASRLGMCAPRVLEQMIPETFSRQEVSRSSINHQRHQAGIPTLDLFGRRDQLDYFSGSDGEDEVGSQEGGGGLGTLSRVTVARPHDRLIRLKKAASVLNTRPIRKPVKVEPIPSPTASLLDTILDSQTLWHSKRSEITSKSDGSLQVVLPKSSSNAIGKEENKIDVRKATAPVVETPMFPSGKSNSGVYSFANSNRGGQSYSAGRTGTGQSHEGRSDSSSHMSSGTTSGPSPSPLRGISPIRFRMNLPPRRPNIHSYPSDNIPPPPPLRLRSPLSEMSFPVTNSPEASPTRDDEEIDIYSDIEQGNTGNNETEEKTFGTLEPPPEPPFLMTMEPPPEPPALLMTLNEDASDDEATGLVIADEPATGDAYDPCANSDDSSNGVESIPKPKGAPFGLPPHELVANYSSDSTTETSSYNPERPTYMSTPIIGPPPRPPSHNSSEAEDNDEECPNFSMYSAASMSLAHREMSASGVDLDIPIPPPIEKKTDKMDFDIPLPNSPKSNKDDDANLNIPVPPDDEVVKSSDNIKEMIVENQEGEGTDKDNHDTTNKSEVDKNIEIDKGGDDSDDSESGEDSNSENSDDADNENEEEDDDEGEVKEKEEKSASEICVNNDEGELESQKSNEANDNHDNNESNGLTLNTNEGEIDKSTTCTMSKEKDTSETAEDECSTQGDVLDLAIEPETNLENNIQHDEIEEQHDKSLAKSPLDEEADDKNVDGGDKSDGLVDITDEEMSVYDCQENVDDLDKLDDTILKSTDKNKVYKSLYSDDENSLVGAAKSAVTTYNSDNVQPPTLPGLEGLETETISESEDVNFDELPIENIEPSEGIIDEEEHSSSKKKKKKKNRKISLTEDSSVKGNTEPLEFEEGEIVEDKPKQPPKKDKKSKSKTDSAGKVEENIDGGKPNSSVVEKDILEKKTKKKKDKSSTVKDKVKSDKPKEIKEKTLKPGHADENISWKKLSKSTKDRNYRDGKEKDKDVENKNEESSKKEKRSREKRKELERYNVRRLISEKPKRPKKDEFGRDISPSKSGSSLSPYRPPRYRSPLRIKNRSRTRSRSWKSRSKSRERRKRRSSSRIRVRSRDRSRRSRSKDRSRRSRSRNRASSHSRDRRRTRTPDRVDRNRLRNRSLSKSKRRRSKTPSVPSRRYRSYSRSWSLSWSRSSMSRSLSPITRRRSRSRSKSKSWTREHNVPSLRKARPKDPPKNLTVIVTNKEALKKKDKKKLSKKKDDQRKKKHNQSPAPCKEVFTSGDNILVSVNFKNANKAPEIIPASTPLLRESSKRKRDDGDVSASAKKKKSTSSKKTPGAKKSNRLTKINEAARNAKPVAIIDLDLSPFRELDLSPKEVIVLSDSGDEGDKENSERQEQMDQLGHSGMNQSMMSLSSSEHKQKSTMSQPESSLSNSFMLNSSGPKTPPEPHIKFSISTKPSQVRILSNPLMEVDEEMQDENIEDVDEILHKGPNTPPEPPPDLNTPASPPTTPYDPFDPTKSRSPSPQPRGSEIGSQHNSSREDKLDNVQNEIEEQPHSAEPRTSPPAKETEDLRKTPELAKTHSTPKSDPIFADLSPKLSPAAGSLETNKLTDDTLMKPIQKILASANKLDVQVHKSPEKLVTVVMSQQQVKSANQTPKQAVQPLKPITPNKHQTPKSNTKHQLFSSSLVKQVPILGALSLLPGPPVYTPSLGLNSSKNISGIRSLQNGDPSDDMDIDPSSPYSPGSSEGDDLFEPPIATPPRTSTKPAAKTANKTASSANKFDALFGSPAKPRHGKHTSSKTSKKLMKTKPKGNKKEEVKVKLDEDQLKILDELPSSAVEMQVKDKFLKKLNRQERVVEEVKLVLKPHYAKKHVTKEEYKEILRRAVPKICHNRSGEINPMKIQFLIEAYVKKFRYAKKKAAGALPTSAAPNKPKPQKSLWS